MADEHVSTDSFIDKLFRHDKQVELELRDFTPQDEKDSEAARRNWFAYERARDSGHTDWLEIARKCDSYYRGDQWEKAIVDELDAQNRPHITVNQVLSTVNQVLGEHIKTRPRSLSRPGPHGPGQSARSTWSLVGRHVGK